MRNLLSELLLAQSKKVKSERFAAPNASVTKGQYSCPFVVLVSLDVEINPRFYRGKKKERSEKKYGELGASRKTFKKEEPLVK